MGLRQLDERRETGGVGVGVGGHGQVMTRLGKRHLAGLFDLVDFNNEGSPQLVYSSILSSVKCQRNFNSSYSFIIEYTLNTTIVYVIITSGQRFIIHQTSALGPGAYTGMQSSRIPVCKSPFPTT